MSREAPAPFCERLGVQFPRPTRHSLHWCLDVSFREDECRIRHGHAAENFAVLRHIALSLLKQDTSVKAGIQAKRFKAALDPDYLLKILTGQQI